MPDYEAQALFEGDFEPLEEESYECYSCAWVGEHPFEQEQSLWDDEEIIFLCPLCGSMIM